MLLIHPFPTDGTIWPAQADALRALGHRVLTPHLPGFGPPGGGGELGYPSLTVAVRFVC